MTLYDSYLSAKYTEYRAVIWICCMETIHKFMIKFPTWSCFFRRIGLSDLLNRFIIPAVGTAMWGFNHISWNLSEFNDWELTRGSTAMNSSLIKSELSGIWRHTQSPGNNDVCLWTLNMVVVALLLAGFLFCCALYLITSLSPIWISFLAVLTYISFIERNGTPATISSFNLRTTRPLNLKWWEYLWKSRLTSPTRRTPSG